MRAYMEGNLICKNQLVHYLKEGVSAKNLVLLHGWGSSADSFKPIVPFLVKAGWSVTMPDLPGFGKSESPKQPFSVNDYAGVVFEFLAKMKLPGFPALAGHSFGGRIAIKMAAAHPEKFSKLILVDAAGVADRNTLKILLLRLLTKAGKKIFSLPGLSSLEPSVRKLFHTLIGSEDYARAAELGETFRMRETFIKVIEEDLSGTAARIALPTLILWGEKDAITPLEEARKLNNLIKNSKLEIVKDAGHYSFVDKTCEFQKKLIHFMANHAQE